MNFQGMSYCHDVEFKGSSPYLIASQLSLVSNYHCDPLCGLECGVSKNVFMASQPLYCERQQAAGYMLCVPVCLLVSVARMDVAIALSGDSSVLSLLEEEINTTYSTTGPYLVHSVLDFDIFFDFL